MPPLADRIRALCKERNVTVQAVENACDLSGGTISKWNKAWPNSKNLKAVAEFFGKTMEELLAPE